MQKKLYFLNEEEKNRILNLHESRTKKQYLVNEGSEEGEISVSSSSSTKKTNDIETKLYKERKSRAETLDNKCKTYPSEFIGSPLVKEIQPQLGRQDWEPFRKSLLKIKDLKEYCQISNSLIKGGMIEDKPVYSRKNMLGSGLADYIYKNVWSSDSWKKYFEDPLKNVLKSAGMDTIDSPIEMKDVKTEDWGSFGCVLNLTNPTIEKIKGIEGTDDVWVKRTFKNNRVEYFSNKGRYFIKYPDGTYAPSGTNNFYTYFCGQDNKPYVKRVETSTDNIKIQPKVIDYTLGVGVAQPAIQPMIKDLLKKAGIEGTELNQQTINQLYNFLKN